MRHTHYVSSRRAQPASPSKEQLILERLAFGASASDIAAELSASGAEDETCSPDDVRAAAAHAAVLLREQRLHPPALAGFLQTRPFAGGVTEELPAAADLLAAYASDPARNRIVDRPEPDARERIAAEYAAALLLQESLLTDPPPSPLRDALPAEDRQRIDELLLWASMNGPVKTLEGWLASYERLIEWLERDAGSVLFEEHEDKLTARDRLEQALSLSSPEARALLEGHVQSLDERFRATTREVSASIRPAMSWRPSGWWWHRVPATPGEGFSKRLEHASSSVAEEILGWG